MSNETNEFNQPLKGNSLTADAWKRLKKNKMAFASFFIVIFYVLISLLAPLLPIHSYTTQDLDHQNLPPSFQTADKVMVKQEIRKIEKRMSREDRSEMTTDEKARIEAFRAEVEAERVTVDGKEVNPNDKRYLFGTDDLGRDMLARVIYGGQISIAIGFVGTLTAVLIGILVGSVAGYVGGRVDFLLMRLVDILYGMPYIFIVIIVLALFGGNILALFFALSFVSWLTTSRVVRGQIISLKNSLFVEAARSMGASSGRIILQHLLPNSMGIIIVFATLQIPSFIMQESFLSFLGLGISAPFASWGSLISDGVSGMTNYPWRLFFPALAMTIFLFAMNFLGDGLRDAFDPQSKNEL
ncbi:MAG: ABC transporter permease [Spirochaetales bacterium]|nr:ABC transporter permease [Spirochaetales bacterium]